MIGRWGVHWRFAVYNGAIDLTVEIRQMTRRAEQFGLAGLWTILIVAMNGSAALADGDAKATARKILDAGGVRGGLVVHLGCGDGKVTAALRTNEKYIVHGLDASEANVAAARRNIQAAGLYGPVSIAHLAGTRLPYADNMVNLLVVQDMGKVTPSEVMRVLCPGGSTCTGKGDKWVKSVKPRPKQMDEWTHWLHGADGNAVSHDSLVGPPRQMQWTARPLWSRHHNLMVSLSAMVSSGGRVFTIVDEAPPAMTGDSPDKWVLIARDAFNGMPLWRKNITDWGWRAWSWRWEGRFNQPNQIPKRLVAIGNRVYATLGFNSPLTALDAATGKVIRTYAGTQFTDEILYRDGVLILSINHAAQRAAKVPRDPITNRETPLPVAADPPTSKFVAAIDAATGKMLWKTGKFVGNSTKTSGMERVTHLLLAAGRDGVYLMDRTKIVALDLKSGTKLWEAPRPKSKRYTSRYFHLMSDMCTLVVTDQAVLMCQLEPIQKRIGWRVIKARIRAYSPKTGKTLWTKPCGNWGHFCVPDLFVTGGLAWVHHDTDMAMIGLDLATGEVKRRVSTEMAFTNGHHHRCHRNKATDRYLMTSYRGFEFIDWTSSKTDLNHWVRGACRYGGMPANGLLYATPHPCDCYITGKLNGLIALAPADESAAIGRAADGPQLVKGPAYGAADRKSKPVATGSDDWPTYRHDAGRSGGSAVDAPPELALRWTVKLAGRLSAPVASGGKVVVASPDTHAVHALDAASGRIAWSYTAGGPVDTPPTLYKGLALFGCRDGWVYCLRTNDGKLAWRFRAAPIDRMVGAFGRLESAWPVHGSVLIQNDHAYVVAGRSTFLDGGMIAWRLDPVTGKVLTRQSLSSKQNMIVDTGRIHTADYGGVADLLTGDGKGVFMRQRALFGHETGQRGWGRRLGATAGMLDDSWFNRTYWILDGKLQGETLVHNDETVYAVRSYTERGHGGFVKAGEAKYQLAAVNRNAPEPKPSARPKLRKGSWPKPAKDKWARPIAPRIRAMALAGETLLCAGTPDTIDPRSKNPWAAYEGKRGGILLAISTRDGSTTTELKLDDAPVQDGLAVANGLVYLTTANGRVLCFGKKLTR
jgi:outer membrane protein assembly factor BamB